MWYCTLQKAIMLKFRDEKLVPWFVNFIDFEFQRENMYEECSVVASVIKYLKLEYLFLDILSALWALTANSINFNSNL